MTALDDAFAAMAAGDDADRLRFFACLAGTEVVMLLESEGPDLRLQVFALADGPVVLVFDTEDRLAAFVGDVAPYAALPGRVVAQQLAGQGVAIGLNLGVAPSSFLLDPAAVDWLAGVLAQGPQVALGRVAGFHPPGHLPAELLAALDMRLAAAGAAGLAQGAVLAGVGYADGRRGHLLAVLEAPPQAEEALARMVSEALVFSGVEAGALDVVFLAAADPTVERMAAVGLRFDAVVPAPVDLPVAAGPGMDRDKPPKLR